MVEFLFQNGAAWFTVPALVGALLFLVQMSGLMGDHGDGSDGGAAGHDVGGTMTDSGDLGGHVGHAGDATGADGATHGPHGHGNALAGVLSIQSCAAFAMGFGLGGLGALRGSNWGVGISIVVGVASGLVFVAVLGFLFRQATRLNVSGNIGIGALVGREADVVVGIPAQGAGRGEIRAVIGDRERRCAATSAGAAIATRARVVVVRVNGDNSVTVRPAGQE